MPIGIDFVYSRLATKARRGRYMENRAYQAAGGEKEKKLSSPERFRLSLLFCLQKQEGEDSHKGTDLSSFLVWYAGGKGRILAKGRRIGIVLAAGVGLSKRCWKDIGDIEMDGWHPLEKH